ncbi:MAG: hypothetical protein HW403_605, partial [Dehalococcoidia bacterium]|nr:hypothetical protein [Dehalococcoidia bacterium]
MDTRDHKVEKVQARLKEEREALWNGISAANRDLEGRVYRLGIRCEYESETDTLLITVGRRGKQSTTESAFKGLEVRIDSDSYKISALEIVGFAEYFMAHVDPNVKDVKLLNTVAQAVLELYQPKSSISASPSFDKDPARVAPGTPPNKHPSESAKLDGSIRLS